MYTWRRAGFSTYKPTNPQDLQKMRTSYIAVAYPGILLGFKQIQLKTDDRENGDLGAVAP